MPIIILQGKLSLLYLFSWQSQLSAFQFQWLRKWDGDTLQFARYGKLANLDAGIGNLFKFLLIMCSLSLSLSLSIISGFTLSAKAGGCTCGKYWLEDQHDFLFSWFIMIYDRVGVAFFHFFFSCCLCFVLQHVIET